MKSLILCAVLLCGGGAIAGNNTAPLKFANGKFILAQSYCRMCDNQRTSCVLKCNGAGTCIQNCDYDFQLCREAACQYRR
jgi:hypothetical protein